MKPSRIHYFVAKEWPSKIWLTAFSLGFALWAASSCWSLLVSPTRWTDPLIFFGCSLLAALLGYFVSILVGWPILGPMYYDRSLKNGEPFRPGEMVHILVGPYRDRIVRVTKAYDRGSYAGAHRICVDLGCEAKGGEDVFESIQILRVSPVIEQQVKGKVMPNFGAFDVGPAAEMQKKYGWYVENWTPPIFDPAIVPEKLHDLIPLAARWGICCDITRHDAGEKASDEELADVSRLLKGRHDQIYDFLYAYDDPRGEIPEEVSAFSALLVFEMEEADGPGTPGLLDFRVQKFQESPDPQTRRKLREAYDEVKSWGRTLAEGQPLREAEALLDGAQGVEGGADA